MDYKFVSQEPDRYGTKVVLHATWDEVEKASAEEIDNFVDGMKTTLGAVLPHQRNTSDGVEFVFSGCKTPENLKK